MSSGVSHKNFKHLKEVAPSRPADSGAEQPEVSPTWRAAYAANGLEQQPSTCYDLFKDSAAKYGGRPCLGWRTSTTLPEDSTPTGEASTSQAKSQLGPYTFMTYSEAWDKAAQVGSAMLNLGLQPKQDRVGVIGANSPEWMLAMQGCNRTSLACVPLYDTLTPKAVEFIMNQSGPNLVVAAAPQLPVLLQALRNCNAQGNKLLGVAYWGPGAAETDLQGLRDAGVERVLSWAELLELGAANPRDAVLPSQQDIATILYTSGTAGDPKGVMLTHGAIASTVASVSQFLRRHHSTALNPRDVYYSFLPLGHIFDRVVEEVLIMSGGSVGYFSGNRRRLLDECAALRPTVFCAVPSVCTRMVDGIMAKVKQQGIRQLATFNAAMRFKQLFVSMGQKPSWASPLCDRLFFHKLQNMLGGHVRCAIVAGAPLPPDVADFMTIAMNMPLIQGYGPTETCGTSVCADPFDHSMMGTVGLPLPGVEMRLEAVPELGYLPNDAKGAPRGEICLRGPGMCAGYHKQPELWACSIDTDGFFHTGDVGELTPQGALRIIGKKKDIIKLATGDCVSPELVESALSRSKLVKQVWVHGCSEQGMLVAVVVPNREALMNWAKEEGGHLASLGFAELCKTRDAAKHVRDSLTATGKAARLKGFEFPKAVHLDPAPFSIEHDLITPKMSLKRPQLLKHYKNQVDGMFANLWLANF